MLAVDKEQQTAALTCSDATRNFKAMKISSRDVDSIYYAFPTRIDKKNG